MQVRQAVIYPHPLMPEVSKAVRCSLENKEALRKSSNHEQQNMKFKEDYMLIQLGCRAVQQGCLGLNSVERPLPAYIRARNSQCQLRTLILMARALCINQNSSSPSVKPFMSCLESHERPL